MYTSEIVGLNVYENQSPTRLALDRVADKWTVLIVGRLAKRTHRFGELRRDIDGISQKVLTQKLRELERDGIISRRVYAMIPPKVEYSLTPLGQTLSGPLDGIREWAETHIDAILVAHRAFEHRVSEDPADEGAA